MLLWLVGLAVLALIAHVAIGTSLWYSPGLILSEIGRGPQGFSASVANGVVWETRLPRACAALLTGAVLGLTGSAFQAQFRNPLAEPYVTGVASGAAVGGVAALILGVVGPLATMGFGFLGGMLALMVVMSLGKRNGVMDASTLLLAGVVVASLLSSVMSFAILASGRDSNVVLLWLLGSFTNSDWPKVEVLFGATAVGSVILVRQSRKLNALAMGEETAANLGVDVPRLRLILLTVGTAMTAAAVGAFGVIGFLGLVAPHLARKVLGVDWRWSLVGAGVLGAGLMVLADLVAMRGLNFLLHTSGMEAPVGILTAILGAPWLLVLLRKTDV